MIIESLYTWIEYLIRFSHLVAGIAWIGSSFYFIWLDSSFEPPAIARKNVEGELFMVHGGFYYQVEKRKIWPNELPKTLHWFKWEATLTVLTGYLLLIWLYYLQGASLLVKAGSGLNQTSAIALSLAIIAAGWILYDSLWKFIENKFSSTLLTAAFIVGFIFLNLNLFSARGAFIQTGAMLGTMMLLNVWVRILPGQKKMIADAEKGLIPDTSFSVKAKTRSVHNTYFTFPVLLIMLSNHYPSIYNHPHNGLLLLGLGLAGAMIRHAMVTKVVRQRWILIPAIFVLALTIFIEVNGRNKLLGLSSDARQSPPDFSEVYAVFEKRCHACHGEHPTDDIFKEPPKGIILQTREQIELLKDKIYQQVVVGQTMPLANKTQITDEERALIGAWIQSKK